MELSAESWALLIFSVTIFVVVILPGLRAWWYARSVGVSLSPLRAAFMRFRGVDPRLLAQGAARLREAGYDVDLLRLEAHYLAMGQVESVADLAELNRGVATFDELAAKDIADNWQGSEQLRR